jgi:subtilisin family serine protease
MEMGRFRAVSVRRLAVAGFATAAAVGLTTAPASAAPDVQILGVDSPTAIDDSYIVVYKDSAAAEATSTASALGSKVHFQYSEVFSGFAASMSEEEAKKLAADPDVAYVEQNQVLSITADQANPPSWGIDRIDQRSLPVDNNYSYTATGAGVRAYIIDTGLDLDHPDFSGRATTGFDAIDGGAADDGNGHGTHVAGTVGGELHGVAKDVSLVGVRVLNNSGSGTTAQVLAGVNWVTENAVLPAVANMSLGINAVVQSLNDAVAASIAEGVTYAIASGNSNANACNFSPASTPTAITVNASTASDARASFSNFGNCTDIFAPGNAITSTWLNGGTNTISGTSMAAPHVAGAAALYLEANPTAAPAAVAAALIASSTPSKITSPGTNSPNRLLYTGTGAVEPPPTNGPCAAATNANNVTISDNSTSNSPIAIAGCTGTASGAATVTVAIVHTYIGDLIVNLVAPDGTLYTLSNREGGSTDNINATYTLNLTSETANGTWNLRVQDAASADVGFVDSWTLDL